MEMVIPYRSRCTSQLCIRSRWFYSRPTLLMSKTPVRQLEARLRVKRLSRTTRRAKVTADGVIYYKQAQVLFAALDEAETLLSSVRSAPRGRRSGCVQQLGELNRGAFCLCASEGGEAQNQRGFELDLMAGLAKRLQLQPDLFRCFDEQVFVLFRC